MEKLMVKLVKNIKYKMLNIYSFIFQYLWMYQYFYKLHLLRDAAPTKSRIIFNRKHHITLTNSIVQVTLSNYFS